MIFFFQYVFLGFLWLVCYFLFEFIKTPIHEFIHIYFAEKYYPCNIITYSQFYLGKKKSNIKWKKQGFFSSPKGFTIVDNDFLVYTNAQIKAIAIMPTVITLILYILLMGGLSIAIDTLLPLPVYRFVFILSLVLFVLNVVKQKHWSDFKIFLNPEGFKEYMKEQHEHNGKDCYNYISVKGL